MKRYQVVQYAANGNFMSIISGMGKNRGTWDSDHSRSAAYRHAAQCRKDYPYCIFQVEEI